VALDLTDPADNVYAFAKMWASVGDEPAYGCFHGTMFASIGDRRLMPLFGYAGTGVMQARILPNGHARLRGKETGYFTDLATGEPMRTWDNPFTGETVEVFDFLNDRVRGELGLEMPRFAFGGEGDEPSEMHAGNRGPAGGDRGAAPFVLPWQTYGDQVLLEWDYTHRYTNPVTPARWPLASTGEHINPSEHFCFVTSLAALEDRSVGSAPFTAGFSRLSPWWPWMRMGRSGIDGVLFGRMFSRKVVRGLEDIPAPVLEHTERHHPEFLEPPGDWDDGGPISTWEAYARDVPPEVPGHGPARTAGAQTAGARTEEP
jgi:hypothetical protein